MKSIELPMSQNPNESNNPCFSCGACCKNTWFKNVSQTELSLMANEANEFVEITLKRSGKPLDELSYQHEDVMTGIRLKGLRYANNNEGGFAVSLSGSCAQLDVNSGQCQIYDQRPQICANFKVGGDGCNDRRKGVGLPAIRPDGSLIPVETFRQRVEKITTKFVIKVLPVGFGGGF